MTLNICSVSPVMWWYSVPNLNVIEQSASELSRFQYLTWWPWAVLRVGIILTKFDLQQLIRAWVIALFMLIRYVTLWPSPSTSWLWTFTALQMSCVETLYKIWAKSNNLLPSHWRSICFRRAILEGGGSFLTDGSQGGVDPTSPNLTRA